MSVPRSTLVVIGDSIAFHWASASMPVPADMAVVNCGVPRQSSTEVLQRFADDVLAQKPTAVLILCGTNDLRDPDGGAESPDQVSKTVRNIGAMLDIARAGGLKVALCSVPPVSGDRAMSRRDPATIVAVNERLRELADAYDVAFVDIHAALRDELGALRTEFARPDGLHPIAAGYHAMGPPLRDALAQIGLFDREAAPLCNRALDRSSRCEAKAS